nr:MAG TPA: hypothetical protein [Caudoviricetes sp.]
MVVGMVKTESFIPLRDTVGRIISQSLEKICLRCVDTSRSALPNRQNL